MNRLEECPLNEEKLVEKSKNLIKRKIFLDIQKVDAPSKRMKETAGAWSRKYSLQAATRRR